MKRRTTYPGLLLSLGLGAAPLALRAQINDALQDPAFVRAHRLRTATSYEYVQGRRRYVVTRRFARSGQEVKRPQQHPAQSAQPSRWREEQVCDAQDRVAAVKFFSGDTLQWVEHRVYGPAPWPLQSYRYYPARSGKAAYYVLLPTPVYDYWGNVTDLWYAEASMQDGFLRFGTRYHTSYDAQHRRTSTTSYEQVYSPHRTDSTYRDALGRVVRQVAYVHNNYGGWGMWEFVTLYQYNARNQQTSRLGISFNGHFQDVQTHTYRPDGQPLQRIDYRAGPLPYPVPWTEAVQRAGNLLSLSENHEHTQTEFRYNQRGLLTDVFEHWRRTPQYGEEGLDLKSRYRWRYTYYP